MSANRLSKKPPPKSHTSKPETAPFSAADFPALRSFMRGYFHQDMKEEYGSAEDAVREFCEDASPGERAAVAGDWSRFLGQTRGQPLEAINQILTGPLGSSRILTEDEVRSISAVLSRSRTRGKHSA